MFNAFVLVRNFESPSERLDFGEFSLGRIGFRFEELRKIFSSMDVNQDDWIFEKSYTVPPSGPPGSAVGGIPNDIEDILVLFRLYRTGDIAFVRQAIIQPSGSKIVQFPYRAMNDLNSYSAIRLQLRPDECESWRAFANEIRQSQSWNSEWFAVARRFFLYGGAKEFNPTWDDVDRILDYVTSIQAAVVPEMDFVRRRISHRSAMLVSTNPAEQVEIATLMKQLYDVRSSVAHGSKLSDAKRNWLIENSRQIERRVRQVLVAAVQNVPADDTDRRKMLTTLYDPTDSDRGDAALQRFREIRTDAVRKDVARKIEPIVNG